MYMYKKMNVVNILCVMIVIMLQLKKIVLFVNKLLRFPQNRVNARNIIYIYIYMLIYYILYKNISSKYCENKHFKRVF